MISQPSHEIYAVVVPEAKGFQATYLYNFFVPDESVNETGGIPASALTRPGSEVDAAYIQYSTTRIPRFVEFSWTRPNLSDVGNSVNEQSRRNTSFGGSGAQDGSLILNNLSKIISEDDFSTSNFSSVHFHDGEIDDKVHDIVSGSLVQLTLEQDTDGNTSPYKASHRLAPLLPPAKVAPHFITQAMTLIKSQGLKFYLPPNAQNGTGPKPGAMLPKNGVLYKQDYFENLKNFSITTQINNKLLQDLVGRTIKDPTAPQAGDLVNMHGYSKQAKQATNKRFSPAVSESDYKTFLPYIDAQRSRTSAHADKYGAVIVGYIIDKFEVHPNGTLVSKPPIIIDSGNASTCADFQVKFNARYCYCARTIAQLTMPAIDGDTGEVASIKVLVSSRPTNKVYVSTLKLDPPPPPRDVDFVWNYGTNQLLVTWAFPITSERDIAQFQIFRRPSINECFELQKVYNFGTSLTPFPSGESPDGRLVENLTSPATFWIDDEFDWNVNTSRQKGLIYSVCAIDEHALTSNYSAQFVVWFDRFKNKLQTALVSHAGAPKPYPNLYLEGTLFTNTIRVAGNGSKQMKLYFNPEYYYLTDDHNRTIRLLQTNQTGGYYKLQFINTDNLKAADLDIYIDDRTTQNRSRPLKGPIVSFGPKRMVQET